MAWLGIALGAYGGLAGGYHLYLEENPRKILVVVDSSFSMKPVWPELRRSLRAFQDQRYTSYALVTDKRTVHGWERGVEIGKVSPYAPRDFSKLEDNARAADFEDADEVIFFTNAPHSEIEEFSGWRIVRLAGN